MHGAAGGPRLTDEKGGTDDVARRALLVRRIAIGLGILFLAWAALFLAEASRRGSGASFETRATYDQVKSRTHEALPGALWRGSLGLVLVAWGLSRPRKSSPGRGEDGASPR